MTDGTGLSRLRYIAHAGRVPKITGNRLPNAVRPGLIIDGLVRRRRHSAYFRWFGASVLINVTSQLMNALAQRHIWPAGQSHLLAEASNWARWIGLAFIGIAVVAGLRSGELRFWRSRSPSAVASTVASAEADAEE